MGKLSISKMPICGIFLLINGKFSLLTDIVRSCPVGGVKHCKIPPNKKEATKPSVGARQCLTNPSLFDIIIIYCVILRIYKL